MGRSRGKEGNREPETTTLYAIVESNKKRISRGLIPISCRIILIFERWLSSSQQPGNVTVAVSLMRDRDKERLCVHE